MIKLTSAILIVVIFMTGSLPAQTLMKKPPQSQNRQTLKQVFAEETDKIKSESSVIDEKKMERTGRQQTSNRWSKKDKTIMVVIIAAIAALVFVVIKYGKDCKTYDPPGCSLSDTNCVCTEYEQEPAR